MPFRDSFLVQVAHSILGSPTLQVVLLAAAVPLLIAQALWAWCCVALPWRKSRNTAVRRRTTSATQRRASSPSLSPRTLEVASVGRASSIKRKLDALHATVRGQQSLLEYAALDALTVGSDGRFSPTRLSALSGPSSAGQSAWADSSASALPVISPLAIVRPSDETFAPGGQLLSVLRDNFHYQPRYFLLPNGMRVHYIDECRATTPRHTIVLLHGLLGWTFVFRKVIPILVDHGFRVLALDFPGHGRSDKLTDARNVTLGLYTSSLHHFFNQVVLQNAPTSPSATFSRSTPSQQLLVLAQGFSATVLALFLSEFSHMRRSIHRIVICNGYPPVYTFGGNGSSALPVSQGLLHVFLRAACQLAYVLPLDLLNRLAHAGVPTGSSKQSRLMGWFHNDSHSTGTPVGPYDLPFSPTRRTKPYKRALAAKQTSMYQTTIRAAFSLLPAPFFSDPLVLRLCEIFPWLARCVPTTSGGQDTVSSIRQSLATLEYALVVFRDWATSEPFPLEPLKSSTMAATPQTYPPPTTPSKVLVVWGTRDRVWPLPVGEWWADLCDCSPATFVKLSDSGHYTMEDQPIALVDAIRSFL